jgi:hypothetical protein
VIQVPSEEVDQDLEVRNPEKRKDSKSIEKKNAKKEGEAVKRNHLIILKVVCLNLLSKKI